MSFSRILISCFVLWLTVCSAAAQTAASRGQIEAAIEKDGCAVVDERIRICRFDYKYNGQTVEALTFRPVGEGRYPGLILVPGYQGTARTYLMLGTIFAKLGFAALSVGTPGFGRTELKPDFLGENTLNAYLEGYRLFKQEAFVDREKLGLFGYSRGAIAVSLLLARISDLKAAVLGGGIYDLKKAFDELTIEGIKENIRRETDLTVKAFRDRSAVRQAEKFNCPVLIIHGEKDENAPTSQAFLLRDRLRELNKEFEFQILAGHRHGSLGGDFLGLVTDFLSRRLLGQAKTVKFR